MNIKEYAIKNIRAHAEHITQKSVENMLHSDAEKTAKANGWEWVYALGYCSGKEDATNGRKSDHDKTEKDDYALGYHKGYSDFRNK